MSTDVQAASNSAAATTVRRLNWGCGARGLPGWTNSDISAAPHVHVAGDIRLGLPIPDDTFDYIVSIHALPEIPFLDVPLVLNELRRVLKPGGWIRLGLPDMNRAIVAYLNRDPSYFLIGDDVVQSLAGKMIVQLTWFGRSRLMFTPDFAAELLVRSGFREPVAAAYQATNSPHTGIVELDNREGESLFIEARK